MTLVAHAVHAQMAGEELISWHVQWLKSWGRQIYSMIGMLVHLLSLSRWGG